MNNKILLFGNGISQNFNCDEYSYESLLKKFREGLEININTTTDSYYSRKEVKEFVGEILKDLKRLSEFNESVFGDIGNKLSIFFFEQNYRVYHNQYKYREFSSGKEMHEKIMDLIRQKQGHDNTPGEVGVSFLNAYNCIKYAIKKSILINEIHSDGIKIKYPDKFLVGLRPFDSILTTNYFTDLEIKNIKPIYLHGDISKTKKDNFKFSLKQKGCVYFKGNEFKQFPDKKILFGRNYEDKLNLFTIFHGIENREEGISDPGKIVTQNIQIDGADIEIIGMSIEADKKLILDIIDQANSIKIYGYTAEDDKAGRKFLCNNSERKDIKYEDAKKLEFIKKNKTFL